MGLQSFGAYIVLGWLPSFLEHHGVSPVSAGWDLFMQQAAALAASAALVLLGGRVRSHGALACASACLCAVGYVGLLVASPLADLWICIAGCGAGAVFVSGLILISRAAGVPEQAVALSAMAQGGGYALAAIGPFLFGLLYAVTGTWTPPMLLLASSAVLLAVAAFYAPESRER
jgi:CP family cyanate transporter-like MFS transporter